MTSGELTMFGFFLHILCVGLAAGCLQVALILWREGAGGRKIKNIMIAFGLLTAILIEVFIIKSIFLYRPAVDNVEIIQHGRRGRLRGFMIDYQRGMRRNRARAATLNCNVPVGNTYRRCGIKIPSPLTILINRSR